ncbi:MAG: hypothetical protein QW791_07780 [Candidatus Bathyarchaeia archaeon]
MKNVWRKTLLIALICAMISSFLPVKALHTANVYWVDASAPHVIVTDKKANDTLVLRAWQWNDANPINVTFTVESKGGADINRVQVHIPETLDDGVLFHYLRGFAPDQWDTRILEKDFKGWARLIEFFTEKTGITEDQPKANFTIEFGDFIGTIRRYTFTITTIDREGGSVEHKIYLVFDTTPPEVEVTFNPPRVNGVINGLIVPCGNHYFNVTVRAIDRESGLLNYSIIIYNAVRAIVWRNESRIDFPPNVNFTRTWQIWNLDDGDYTLTATFFDMVENSATQSESFTYVSPPRPMITLNPNRGPVGTTVTVSGVNFDAGAQVVVTLTLPPPYGEIVVATTIVNADRTFQTSFIFPETPRGYYLVNVYSRPCNRTATFELTPQIILTPNEVIGPAIINIEATGYIRPDIVPQTGSLSILVNSKDAIQGVNMQSLINWFINENGTLQNIMTVNWNRTTECGFYWPALQPGAYNITLFLTAHGSYWNRTTWVPVSSFEDSTTLIVRSWINEISEAAQNAASSAQQAAADAAAAKTAAEGAKSSADAAKSAADAAKSSADAATSAANAAKSSADAAKSSADAAKSSADSAKSSADSAKSYAQSAAEGIDGAKKAAEGLTIPVYLAVIFSLIAAIIAAACAILVYRKIA